MKKIRIKIFSLLAVSLLMLSSCLTDSDYDNGTIQSTHGGGVQNYVEVHLTTGSNDNILDRSYDVMDRDTTVSFVPVNITSGPVSQDVTITFDTLNTTKNAIVDSLVNVEGFSLAPVAKYTLVDGLKVVIPKGQSTGYIKIKFNPNHFVGKMYVFGFELKTISDTKYKLSNLSTGIIKFGIKNIYDATYICNGYRIRPGNPTETVIDEDRRLSTVNSNTVRDPKFGNYSSYHVNVEITSETMVVGGTTCYKVKATPVNDAGDVVGGMYTTFTGDATAMPAPPANPTEINYYNPVTKTFVLNCYYVSSKNRIMYEVLVRK